MSKKSDTLAVTVPLAITLENVSSLLCSALEGGTGYWAMIGDYVEPKAIWHGGDDNRIFPHIDYPLSQGGAITVWEQLEELDPDFEGEDETANMPAHRLDLPAIVRGLEVMARIAPRHFADFLSENGDAETGDVFLQCCLLGEIKYG
jgi:hypothetical protein